MITDIFFSILLILFIFFSFHCIGVCFERIFNFDKNTKYLSSIIGQFFFIIFITFLFNFFSLKMNLIFKLYIFLSFTAILYCYLFKINQLKFFFKSILFLILPSIILCFLPTIFYGENFYVFRGNHYDHFGQISTGLFFSQHNYNDLNSIIFNENFVQGQTSQKFSKFYYSLALPNLYTRELQALYLGFLFQIKILNISLLSYLLSIYSLSSLSLGFYFFLSQFNNAFSNLKKYLFSLIFSISFWSLYIFEINAYAQLTTYSFSIIFFALILNLEKSLKTIDLKYVNFLCLTSACIFLSYPEESFILFAFLFIFLIYNFRLFFLKKKIFIFYIFLFLFFVSPKLITYIKLVFFMSETKNDWWGYFGSFILGKDNLVLNDFYVQKIKLLLNNYDSNIFSKILEIIKFHLFNEYYLSIINILPSLMGFYYLLPGRINNYLYFILYSVFIFYLFFCILQNLIKVFKFKNKYFFFFKVYIYLFFLLSIFFIIQEKIYILFKIYFFFSPILFFLVFFRFNNKAVLFPRYFLFFLMILFPIYKFSINNNGISRIDSFPSIINKNTKLNMNWSLNYNELKKCSRVLLDIDDYFINLYVANNLDFYSKEYYNKKYSTIILNNFDCKISVINGEFVYNIN
jgi:hypothetical protein